MKNTATIEEKSSQQKKRKHIRTSLIIYSSKYTNIGKRLICDD